MVVPAGGFDVPSDQEVLKLAAELAPGAECIRLGGWISANLRIVAADATPGAEYRADGDATTGKTAAAVDGVASAAGTTSVRAAREAGKDLVLHVHPRYVARRRLRALQRLRTALAAVGVNVPVPLSHQNSTILRCADSLAEVEPYLPNQQLPPTWESYHWLFRATGTLHRVLATIELALPRPMFAHFAAAGTLRSWIAPTKAAVRGSAEATASAERVDRLTRRIRNAWVPPDRLPTHLVHGDIKLENVLRAPDGSTVFLDFGHAARRPRIHDLAFTLTHSVLTVNGHVPTDPADFPWHRVPPLIEEYEAAAGWPLTPMERAALAPYTAAIRAYFACAAWYLASDPIEWLCNQPPLGLSEWLLDNPGLLLPS